MLKKKGLAIGIMGSMILAVISMFVLIGFYETMVSSSKDVAKREVCRKSVYVASIGLKPQPVDFIEEVETAYGFIMAKVMGDQFGNTFELDCSTDYYHVKTDDPERIKEIVADEMAACWSIYGEGEKELFDTKDETFCVVCSRLTFEKEVLVDNFVYYLGTHNIPAGQQSYFEYLNRMPFENYIDNLYDSTALKVHDRFRTNYPLAVMFIMEKDAYPDRATDTLTGMRYGQIVGSLAAPFGMLISGPLGFFGSMAFFTISGSTIGFIAGSDPSAVWDARILLWDYEQLKVLPCTYMEGDSAPLRIVEKT